MIFAGTVQSRWRKLGSIRLASPPKGVRTPTPEKGPLRPKFPKTNFDARPSVFFGRSTPQIGSIFAGTPHDRIRSADHAKLDLSVQKPNGALRVLGNVGLPDPTIILPGEVLELRAEGGQVDRQRSPFASRNATILARSSAELRPP